MYHMGIRHLNKFLKQNASTAIRTYKLCELSGKKIAVDISIYMYKFAYNNALIENVYLMLSLFRTNNIIPIFVFDGKPPNEKKELLRERNHSKWMAEEQYHKLEDTLTEKGNTITAVERKEIMHTMHELKKKSITLKKSDIDNVKNLIRYYGATYYEAPGEADSLCAMLALENKVWACLSEDMDMFVYGCPRVLRYFHLFKETVQCYDLQGILTALGITQKELRQICVLSGTDYNITNTTTFQTAISYYKKFYKCKCKCKQTNESNATEDFYEWLRANHHQVIANYELLQNIYNMFDVSSFTKQIESFQHLQIMDGEIMQKEVQDILKKDGFIFPHKEMYNHV